MLIFECRISFSTALQFLKFFRYWRFLRGFSVILWQLYDSLRNTFEFCNSFYWLFSMFLGSFQAISFEKKNHLTKNSQTVIFNGLKWPAGEEGGSRYWQLYPMIINIQYRSKINDESVRKLYPFRTKRIQKIGRTSWSNSQQQ